jgi:hypothetical protein
MYLEYTCASINICKWEQLMKGARKMSYKKLIKLIKENIPALFKDLALDLYNPWNDSTKQTDTHYILVHSAIEYFISKESDDVPDF